MARFNFGPCPGEEIESADLGTVCSAGDCGVILRYSRREEEFVWVMVDVPDNELLELGLARSLRPEFEQIKLSSHARAVHSIDDVCFNGASDADMCLVHSAYRSI
jgi:hypothetical protein